MTIKVQRVDQAQVSALLAMGALPAAASLTGATVIGVWCPHMPKPFFHTFTPPLRDVVADALGVEAADLPALAEMSLVDMKRVSVSTWERWRPQFGLDLEACDCFNAFWAQLGERHEVDAEDGHSHCQTAVHTVSKH